jgi:hypoxanthine phosphoribosyltransferase
MPCLSAEWQQSSGPAVCRVEWRPTGTSGTEERVKRILDQNQIREGVSQLAEQVKTIYEGRPITIVAILTGSLVLLADLIRQLEMPLRVALVQASRLRTPDEPRQEMVISEVLLPNLKNRDVLVIDDIFDTGHTLVEVLAQLLHHEPASLRSAVLMRKVGRSEVPIAPDIVMFEIPDEFVVGYGLDYEDRFRNLPYVAALEPEDLSPV